MTEPSIRKHQKENRRKAREQIMQLFFQMEAQGDYSQEKKETFLMEYSIDCHQKKYFETLSSLLMEQIEHIDRVLNKSSSKWNTNRMAKVDLAVLRLATGEILYMEEVPDSVAVNEAVELARKFGTENSSKFVNGVLGKVVREKQG